MMPTAAPRSYPPAILARTTAHCLLLRTVPTACRCSVCRRPLLSAAHSVPSALAEASPRVPGRRWAAMGGFAERQALLRS